MIPAEHVVDLLNKLELKIIRRETQHLVMHRLQSICDKVLEITLETLKVGGNIYNVYKWL